jgi:hypothetical protein
MPLCQAKLPQQEEIAESVSTLKIKWIRAGLPQ